MTGFYRKVVILDIYYLYVLYENGTIIQKRKIIGSVFPEKLTFYGFQFRTTRVNEALEYIMLTDNKIGSEKMEQIAKK